MFGMNVIEVKLKMQGLRSRAVLLNHDVAAISGFNRQMDGV